jgi:transposase
VLAECAEPGASIAQIARSHGLHAKQVHKWRCVARAKQRPASTPKPEGFIALPMAPACVTVNWPTAAASECAAWLRDMFK